MDDWYWAAPRNVAAGKLFVIEHGQERLWERVRAEIDANERCRWLQINRKRKVEPDLADVLDLMLTVVPVYGVEHNRFVMEAAKIPAFADFLRNARADLCNYVSNPAYSGEVVLPERYTDDAMRRLGRAVNQTLKIEDDWF